VYAGELALSIILVARSLGFSWLMATASAQLYLYLLFPPFATVFQIYNWYGLAPYFSHLTAALNCAPAVCRATSFCAAPFSPCLCPDCCRRPSPSFSPPLLISRSPLRSSWDDDRRAPNGLGRQ